MPDALTPAIVAAAERVMAGASDLQKPENLLPFVNDAELLAGAIIQLAAVTQIVDAAGKPVAPADVVT